MVMSGIGQAPDRWKRNERSGGDDDNNSDDSPSPGDSDTPEQSLPPGVTPAPPPDTLQADARLPSAYDTYAVLTTAPYGTTENPYISSVSAGVTATQVGPDQWQYSPTPPYQSLEAFLDPDGNTWLLRRSRHPDRATISRLA